MNYLKYIEHAAENLQFYLWFRDYSARWEQLPQSERVLAPEWTQAQAAAETAGSGARPKRGNPQVTALLKGTDFAEGSPMGTDRADPFNTPPNSSFTDEKRDAMSDYGSSTEEKSLGSGTVHRAVAEQAFEDAGMKWKPCKPRHLFEVRELILISHSHCPALS